MTETFSWGAFHFTWISVLLIRWVAKRLFRVGLEVIIGTTLYGLALIAIRAIRGTYNLSKRAAGVRIHIPEVKRQEIPTNVLDFNTFYRLTKLNVVLGHGKRRIVADLDKAHTLVAGTTGAGKTVCINSVLIQLITRPEYGNYYDIFLIDLKADENDNLHRWAPVIAGYYAIDADGSTEQAIEAIEDILRRMHASDGSKRIVVIIDELVMLTEQAPNKELRDRGRRALLRISAQLRSKGALLVGTQRPHFEALPRNVSSNFERKVCFRVDDQETAQLVLRSAKKPREDFSKFPKGQFMMQFEGERVIGRTTMVEPEDIDAAIAMRIDLDAEEDVRLRLLRFAADGLPKYAQVAGINKITPQFTGLNSKQVEAYYRNFVNAGAFEPIIMEKGKDKGKSRGTRLAVEYPEAVALVKQFIVKGEWRENPPPIEK